MADLGAVGIGIPYLKSNVMDSPFAQDITINPFQGVLSGPYTARPYMQNWKQVSGNIKDDTGANTIRTVYLFRRETGELVCTSVSDSAGNYIAKTPYVDEHIRVVLDDGAGILYNDILDRVIPG